MTESGRLHDVRLTVRTGRIGGRSRPHERNGDEHSQGERRRNELLNSPDQLTPSSLMRPPLEHGRLNELAQGIADPPNVKARFSSR